MKRLSKVSVSGPLEGFAVGFAADLAGWGYSPSGAEAQLRLMKQVSEWLETEQLSVGDLNTVVVGRYVLARRARYSNFRSERALVPMLRFLRVQGAAPAAVLVAADAVEVLLGRFAQFLTGQRGLAAATVHSYVFQVRPFLVWYADQPDPRWEALAAAQVERFIVIRDAELRPRSLQVGLNALRAFLRWMCLQGLVSDGLADMIGSVAGWTPTGLPRGLTAGQISDLLTGLSSDTTAARHRDEAMLALMWRMGLRAGEVAALRLDDIDWGSGILIVHGKGDRREQVPLPVDVGDLLVTYLQRGRPAGRSERQVFLAVDAPHHRLGAAAVSSVVSRAAGRGGVPAPCAAHRLRHTAACRVLTGGGGLVEAGQLLRHASAAATAVYARCDLNALNVIARAWPTTTAVL